MTEIRSQVAIERSGMKGYQRTFKRGTYVRKHEIVNATPLSDPILLDCQDTVNKLRLHWLLVMRRG